MNQWHVLCFQIYVADKDRQFGRVGAQVDLREKMLNTEFFRKVKVIREWAGDNGQRWLKVATLDGTITAQIRGESF